MPDGEPAVAPGSNPFAAPPAGIDVEALLEQPLRRRLLDIIHDRPGVHASELCRQSGEPWGTVQYHLGLLRKTSLVTALEAGRERRLFPMGMDPARARLVSLLSHGRRGEIAHYIREHPGSRQVDICDAVDVTRKTFRLAVRPLVDEHLVAERRGLQSTRYYPEPSLGEALDGVALGL
jgi:predicted transcriptional regulator